MSYEVLNVVFYVFYNPKVLLKWALEIKKDLEFVGIRLRIT